MSLLILVGASGVGKTTISKLLCEKWGFHTLPNFTTRQLRDGEVDRFHLGYSELDTLISDERVAFVNQVFGEKYGVLKSDLCHALNSEKFYLFDIDRRHLHKLEGAADELVFILPETNTQITHQLINARRFDRVEQSNREQEEICKLIKERNAGDHLIINRTNFPSNAAAEIASLCNMRI